MKALLLHPEDTPPDGSKHRWDLIIDFGRAPASTYADWSRKAGCRVVTLYDFADEIQDLYRVKALLEPGMGQIVDQFGIDWWDITSILILEDLLRFILVGRLAKELSTGCELYCTRPNPLANVIGRLRGGKVYNLETGFELVSRRVRHYSEAFSNLDYAQIKQVIQDKFDSDHSIRRLRSRPCRPMGPVTLLPSGYINVSRMAVAYAAMLPHRQFLLVYGRDIGKLQSLPENVKPTSLDPYFTSGDSREIAYLLQRWKILKTRLISSAEEYAEGETSGLLSRISPLVRSGVAVRNAWNRVFDTESIAGCLCTDDTVPYTRIPLILSKNRGIPALACHHGALDYRMAVKTLHGDFYLAKGEMERDYLCRVCQVPPDKIVTGGPVSATLPSEPIQRSSDRPWLVFFSEPYQAYGWRSEEIYRDLLPKLRSLAKSCGLRLVLRPHPFESSKSIRRLLRKHMSKTEACKIDVLTGPTCREILQNTNFAITVQSTVALECNALGIPVFLCTWLREPFGGYVKQYARFGVGHPLDSADEIDGIPRLLGRQNVEYCSNGARWQAMDPVTLHTLLHGTYSLLAEART